MHTGFEDTKDFPIRHNDIIAGRYQVVGYIGSAAFRFVAGLTKQNNAAIFNESWRNKF
jgi:hypothetical protein